MFLHPFLYLSGLYLRGEKADRLSVNLTGCCFSFERVGTLNSAASRRIERLAFLWKPALWRLKFPFPWYSYRRHMLRISPVGFYLCWERKRETERERERNKDSEEMGERGARDTNRTGGPCHTLVLIRDEDTINEGYRAAKNPRHRVVYQRSQIETAS